MRVNAIYRSLLDKSVNSMLAAIEIYNKPNFAYREESFAILATNAIELLLKAQLLKLSAYKMQALYVLQPVLKRDGTPHARRKKPQLNRSGNPVTIGLFDAIKRLADLRHNLSPNHLASVNALVEMRDNAIHFYNQSVITKELQEIGFATIKNYFHLIQKWEIEIDLTEYNLYLMPLAYVNAKVISDGVLTDEVKNYLAFVRAQIQKQDETDLDFDIAVSIDVNFNKSNSFDAVPFSYGPDGVVVNLREEDIRSRFPLSYADVCKKARRRYADFKQNADFNGIMRGIKSNAALHHERKLDPDNHRSQKKSYYSTNIWQNLDKHYSKR